MALGRGEWFLTIDRPENATRAMHYGSGAAVIFALVTAVINGAALYLGYPVMGAHGWGLIDAALLAVIAWRVWRLSLPWAIVGLVMFTLEVLYKFSHSTSILRSGIVGAFLWGPCFVNAVRGGLYLRKLKSISVARAEIANSGEADSKTQVPTDITEAAQVLRDEENRKFSQKSHARKKAEPEPSRLPECTGEEYNEFLNCMRRGERKFQRAGYTLHDEYAAWLKDRRKRLARMEAAPIRSK